MVGQLFLLSLVLLLQSVLHSGHGSLVGISFTVGLLAFLRLFESIIKSGASLGFGLLFVAGAFVLLWLNARHFVIHFLHCLLAVLTILAFGSVDLFFDTRFDRVVFVAFK